MFTSRIFALALFCSCCNAYTVVPPTISLLDGGGIRFSYPGTGGVTLVGYHYSVDKALNGVESGTYNQDVNTPDADNNFVLENYGVGTYEGCTVNYWISVATNTGGYTLTDQSWIAPSDTTTTQATTTTKKATTQATTEVTSTVAGTTTVDGFTSTQGNGGGGGGDGGGTVIVTDGCSNYPCDSACDQNVPPCNGLIFEETWDKLDFTRWQHELTMSGGGNWEFQVYTNNRSNSYVRDNTLYILPTLTADHYGEAFLSSGTIDMWGSTPADFCTANSFWGCMRTGTGTNYLNPIQSARLRTVNSFSFKYGYMEVEAKMPRGDWIWPAIWLLPRYNAYGQWPASGEIDLIESRGNTDLTDSSGVSHGCDAMGSTLHWGPYYPLNGYTKTTTEVHANEGTFASDFHRFGVNWTEDNIEFYVDDELIATNDPGSEGFWSFGDFDSAAPGSDNPWEGSPNKMAPFDQEFFIILNVAVGGTNGFFNDAWTSVPAKPWSNTSPTAMRDFWQAKDQWYPTWDGENAAMKVKSIRVWKNKP